MTVMKTRPLVALLLGSVLALPAAAADKVVIGYSAPGLVGAQAQIQAGLVNAGKAKGWEVVTTTSGGDAQKQLNDINDFIAQKVNAIVAVPDDSAGVCQAVKAAKEANIPFYTIDRAPQGCEVDMVVLSDNYLAGKQSGEATVEFLKAKYGSAKGKVLEITGNLAQNVAQLRGSGFEDVIKKNPDIQLITKVGDWDSAKGVDIVRDVASTEADLDAAKSYLTGSYALRFDTNSKIASQLLGLMQEGFGPDYVENRNKMIDAVTMADAKRVAARLLKSDDLIVTVVGKPDGMKSEIPAAQGRVAAPTRG